MKKSIKILSFIILLSIVSYQAFSQNDQLAEFEAYGKAHIALAELIKNSYDADATICEIVFGPDSIEIVDTFDQLIG